MNFTVRPALAADLPAVCRLIEQSVAALPEPDWFVADDADYLRAHLGGPLGFCLVAESEGGELAAYFVVKFAGAAPDALGRFLAMTEAELCRTAQMDSCCVAQGFRGNSLEGRLIAAAEARLAGGGYDTLLATVHPDNLASLYSGLNRGYTVAKTIHCYGGKTRCLLRKQL